jgi:glycosyltransferase involved in cell wall biosynthesis
MQPRVAYLTSQYPAASHTFIRREVDALRRRGIDLRTFSVRQPSPSERKYPEDALAFETTGYLLPMQPFRFLRAHVKAFVRRPLRYVSALALAMRHRAPGTRALLWSLFYFGEAVVLAEALERDGIEHVHSHFANVAGTVGLVAASYLGIGWSVTLHGDMDFDYPSRLLLEAKARAARFVVCVSYFGRAQAMRVIAPSHWEKLCVVRCGVDIGKFTPAAASPKRRLRIVSVGRLSPEKGQLGLLEALAGLVRRGLDVELKLVGTGPLRETIEREIERLGLGDRCELLGQKTESEVAAELAHADIFALSSFLEGLPVVLMEALAMKLAVVAPCVAGIPELVQHERTGLLFAPSNWRDLEEQLVRFAGDPELRVRLGNAGRERVEAEFDSYRVVDTLDAKFRRA